MLESSIETVQIGTEEHKVPNLSESVSLGKDGKIHVTITNLSMDEDYDIQGIFTDAEITAVEGKILTQDVQAYNTFENPDCVKNAAFDSYKITAEGVDFTIPKNSVIHLAITTK